VDARPRLSDCRISFWGKENGGPWSLCTSSNIPACEISREAFVAQEVSAEETSRIVTNISDYDPTPFATERNVKLNTFHP
jgi:hypothetical protein